MLETYFLKPETVDRVRSSWLGPEIERYVTWLADHGYSSRCVWRHVPLLVAFAEFAHRNGAEAATDLEGQVDAFVAWRVRQSRELRHTSRPGLAKEIRGPVEHMLSVTGYSGRGARRDAPFSVAVPGFLGYLEHERGLRPATIAQYRYQLLFLEDWLDRAGAGQLSSLSPALIRAFIADLAAGGLAKASIGIACSAVRVFLRYAHREGALSSDLSTAVGHPLSWRLADLPRSISWGEVGQVLASVDQRTPGGRRDYAMLVLMATYGLRSREVAALTLDDIDWRRERLAVPSRKAGHSTAFPLSGDVGEALAGYLRHGRPQTGSRRVFFRSVAPVQPLGPSAVSDRARHHLLAAGIQVRRPGSHTLRHSCLQRLADTGFAWKTIGDFAGHRSPRSTEIYTKTAVGPLRQIALGDGEEVLSP
jgi:integrase/recombinase XerD